mmetsp:Transcript_7483/g.19241  ORF Transcript_7483/g.19241 Transcript_7483/m.19241 type:complete len:84 (-) Transcript_7483:2486-2737(-)
MSGGHHGARPLRAEDDEVDPWEARIEASGCAPQHYALQDCYAETGDWRKCQSLMKAFQLCMSKNTKARAPPTERVVPPQAKST